ncbi:hypothetical protein OROHE_026991 [Orobanche hederae]
MEENKRSKSNTSPLKLATPEDGGSAFRGEEETNSQQTSQEDYTKFTNQRLTVELTAHGEVYPTKNPKKKELLALYERHVLKRK